MCPIHFLPAYSIDTTHGYALMGASVPSMILRRGELSLRPSDLGSEREGRGLGSSSLEGRNLERQNTSRVEKAGKYLKKRIF